MATASGDFSEILEWKGWDVSQWAGKEARLEILDYNTGSWGHLNLDQIAFADSLYPSSAELADWLDYGADHYATISWHNLPEGSRPMLTSWMSNWDYAASMPTGDFRGSMTLPREYALRDVNGEIRVVQTPVAELQELRREHFTAENVTLTGEALNGPLSGKALEIVAVFDAAAASASEFGLKLRVGAGEETLVGYDVAEGEVFVDRTNSGFLPSEAFAARHGARSRSWRTGRSSCTSSSTPPRWSSSPMTASGPSPTRSSPMRKASGSSSTPREARSISSISTSGGFRLKTMSRDRPNAIAARRRRICLWRNLVQNPG